MLSGVKWAWFEVRRLAFCHITSWECDIVLSGVKWAWFEVSSDLH